MSSKWQINHCPYSNHMYHYGSRSNKKAIKYPGNPVHPGNPVQGGNALFSNKAKYISTVLKGYTKAKGKINKYIFVPSFSLVKFSRQQLVNEPLEYLRKRLGV